MLMTVYVEYVFLDNFCIDAVLLLLVSRIVHVRPKWWLVLIASLLGTAVAFVLPMFSLPIWASIPLKLVLSALMSVIVLVGQPFLVNFVGYVLLLFMTFALGGMTTAFIYLFTKNPIDSFAIKYSGAMPVGLLIAATYFVFCGVLYLLKYVKERRIVAPFLRNLIVQIDGRKIELFGYLDSGNRLEDQETGKPVVVVSRQALERQLPKEWKMRLKDASLLPLKCKAHMMCAQTAIASGEMLVFEPDFLHIGSEKKRALIGVCDQKFSEVVRVDALFGPNLA